MDRTTPDMRSKATAVPALGRSFLALAVFSVVSVSLLCGMIVYLQDRNSEEGSVKLVQSGLHLRTERQSAILLEYAYWDVAVEKLAGEDGPDLEWFESEYSDYLYNSLGIALIRLFDGQGLETARSVDGVIVDASGEVATEPSVLALIARARMSPDNEAPVTATAYIDADGQIHVASAVRMTTYDEDNDFSTDHILLFAQAVNEAFLEDLAATTLVENMRLSEQPAASGETAAAIAIQGAARPLQLIWTPQKPGTQMLPWLLGGVTGFLLLVIVAGVLFMRRISDHGETLARAHEISEHANRQKSEFLANMSHELRTPLNAVIGFADIMRNQYLGPVGNVRYLEYATDIRNSGEHLLSLVNGLLDMSKIEAGRFEVEMTEVDLPDLVTQCQKMVEVLAKEKRITLTAEFSDDLPVALADERALRQVLINLMSNAVKFTPDGGVVTVKAAGAPGRGVFLQVTDTGIGISARDIELVLEPFYQVKAHPDGGMRGTGLGLSVSRRLVELMGGRLSLESTPGEGTTATVELSSLEAGAEEAPEPVQKIA